MAKNYYAVAEGTETGIFENWDDVAPLVQGYSGSSFKGFDRKEKAEEWLASQSDGDVKRGGLVCYTDGSNTTGHQPKASWAYVIGRESKSGKLNHIFEMGAGKVEKYHLPDYVDYRKALAKRNICGELVAAAEAIKALARVGGKALMCHDYLGVEKYVTGAFEPGGPLERWYSNRPQDNVRGYLHVKGHSGIRGNEMADDLARIALHGTF